MLDSLFLAGSVGVGVQGTPLCTPAITPGSMASAGQLYVTDTGTQAETITVSAFPAGGEGQALTKGQHQMPAGWVHVSYPRRWLVLPQSSVSLQPGGSLYLPVAVSVPAGTPDGVYAVNIWAHTAGTGSSGKSVTVSTGAGAATMLLAGVGEAPSCTIPAPAPQAGSPDQYAPAAVTAPAKKPLLSSAATDWLVVIAALFGLYCLLTRKK